MKKLQVKNCEQCPLNTWNISGDLINIGVNCEVNPEHDISYDITLKFQTCILSQKSVSDYIKNKSIPRNCPLEDENI
jgi:hypothetical protein